VISQTGAIHEATIRRAGLGSHRGQPEACSGTSKLLEGPSDDVDVDPDGGVRIADRLGVQLFDRDLEVLGERLGIVGQRLDPTVGVMQDDHVRRTAAGLDGMELEGEAPVEGRWVDRVVGLNDVPGLRARDPRIPAVSSPRR